MAPGSFPGVGVVTVGTGRARKRMLTLRPPVTPAGRLASMEHRMAPSSRQASRGAVLWWFGSPDASWGILERFAVLRIWSACGQGTPTACVWLVLWYGHKHHKRATVTAAIAYECLNALQRELCSIDTTSGLLSGLWPWFCPACLWRRVRVVVLPAERSGRRWHLCQDCGRIGHRQPCASFPRLCCTLGRRAL